MNECYYTSENTAKLISKVQCSVVALSNVSENPKNLRNKPKHNDKLVTSYKAFQQSHPKPLTIFNSH